MQSDGRSANSTLDRPQGGESPWLEADLVVHRHAIGLVGVRLVRSRLWHSTCRTCVPARSSLARVVPRPTRSTRVHFRGALRTLVLGRRPSSPSGASLVRSSSSQLMHSHPPSRGRTPARACVFVHNHPSGDCAQHRGRGLTERLRAAAELVGVVACDHVIVATSGYFSFVEAGRVAAVDVSPAAAPPTPSRRARRNGGARAPSRAGAEQVPAQEDRHRGGHRRGRDRVVGPAKGKVKR